MDSLKKLDAVAANKIWYERLKREKACIRMNEDFRINPKLLKRNRMPAKPCTVNPSELIQAVQDGVQADVGDKELQDSIFKAAKPPQEKFRWPMTANQAIGWSWEDAAEFRKDDVKWLATHGQSELVKYTENYVMAFGKSPYAK